MSATAAPGRSRLLDALPVVATLAVAIAAGCLAAVASRDVALHTGAVAYPALAWLLPLILEGGAVTAGLLAWRRHGAGQGSRPERCVLLVLVGIAVWVNAAHVANPTPLALVLAAAPPVVLVVSVELLLRNRDAADAVAVRIQARAERAQRRAPSAAEPVAKGKSVASPGTAPEPPSVHQIRPAPATGDRAALVESMLVQDPAVTGAQMGEALGVSASQGRRLLAAARGRAAQAA